MKHLLLAVAGALVGFSVAAAEPVVFTRDSSVGTSTVTINDTGMTAVSKLGDMTETTEYVVSADQFISIRHDGSSVVTSVVDLAAASALANNHADLVSAQQAALFGLPEATLVAPIFPKAGGCQELGRKLVDAANEMMYACPGLLCSIATGPYVDARNAFNDARCAS